MIESPPEDAAAEGIPQLPLMRYRLRFTGPDAGAIAGRQLGSAWRGAFGRALRRSVCITNLPRCDGCALLDHCVYPRTFEKRTPPGAEKLRLYPNAPNPYVLAPADAKWDSADSADETIKLGVTLFGTANDDAPIILQALRTAAAEGLTGRRVELAFVDVAAEAPAGAAPAWTTMHTSAGLVSPPALLVTPPESLVDPPTAVRVRLLSPLRIRADGRYVGPDRLTFRAFAANLLRRISLLTHFFGHPWELDFAALLEQATGVRIAEAELHWREGTRHSSRQQARIPMGGLVGTFVASGPAIGALWPCLWLGQWTHIGKGCTMGLGRYVVEPPSADLVEAGWPSPAPL